MKLICPICQKEFSRAPSQCRVEHPCCSRTCDADARRQGPRRECPVCGVPVLRTPPSRIRHTKGGVICCSRAHAAIYRRTRKTDQGDDEQ